MEIELKDTILEMHRELFERSGPIILLRMRQVLLEETIPGIEPLVRAAIDKE